MEEQSRSPNSAESQDSGGDCLDRVARVFYIIGITPRRVAPLRIVPVAAAIIPLGWVIYNPDTVCRLSDDEFLALMAHEAYHLTMMRHRKRLMRAILLSILKIGVAIDLALTTIVLGALSGLGADNPIVLIPAVLIGLVGSSQVLPKLAKLGVPVFQEEIEANTFAAEVAGYQALYSLFMKLRRLSGPQATLLKMLRGF